MENDPFCFLALLCDTLQSWDRKRGFNPARNQLPYSTYGSAFDLEIVGDFLHVTEFGEGLDIGKRMAALREHFDQFLTGASRLIRLSLGEWTPR